LVPSREWTLKSFKLPTIWLLDPASRSHRWLKQKASFSREMNHHAIACYAYKAERY
jgi:hypothetical protein